MHHLEDERPVSLSPVPSTDLETDQHFVVDAMGQRQVVEHFRKQLKHLHGILRFDFALESVHLIHG